MKHVRLNYKLDPANAERPEPYVLVWATYYSTTVTSLPWLPLTALNNSNVFATAQTFLDSLRLNNLEASLEDIWTKLSIYYNLVLTFQLDAPESLVTLKHSPTLRVTERTHENVQTIL